MSKYKILNPEEINNELQDLPDWSVSDNKLKAEVTFKDFNQAFSFMSMVAPEFDKANHHPTWSNTYKKVSIEFSTHDAGDKITTLDIEMARFVSDTRKAFN